MLSAGTCSEPLPLTFPKVLLAPAPKGEAKEEFSAVETIPPPPRLPPLPIPRWLAMFFSTFRPNRSSSVSPGNLSSAARTTRLRKVSLAGTIIRCGLFKVTWRHQGSQGSATRPRTLRSCGGRPWRSALTHRRGNVWWSGSMRRKICDASDASAISGCRLHRLARASKRALALSHPPQPRGSLEATQRREDHLTSTLGGEGILARGDRAVVVASGSSSCVSAPGRRRHTQPKPRFCTSSSSP